MILFYMERLIHAEKGLDGCHVKPPHLSYFTQITHGRGWTALLLDETLFINHIKSMIFSTRVYQVGIVKFPCRTKCGWNANKAENAEKTNGNPRSLYYQEPFQTQTPKPCL
jgi:hypothetical protein